MIADKITLNICCNNSHTGVFTGRMDAISWGTGDPTMLICEKSAESFNGCRLEFKDGFMWLER
jgi:hypothetical protein